MQNRSSLPVCSQSYDLPEDFPIRCMSYVQRMESGHPLHAHDCLELGRVISGSGLLFIGGELYPFSAHSVSVIPPFCVHDSHVAPPSGGAGSQWQFIFVNLEGLGIASAPLAGSVTLNPWARRLFDLIFSACERRHEGWQEETCALLRALMIELQADRTRALPARESAYRDSMLVLQHRIATEYAADWTVARLAQCCSMAPSTFRRHFTAVAGMSPQQYIIEVRLSIAEHLLKNTRESILSISQRTGFKTLSSFNRLFKKAYGCPPSLLRKCDAPARRSPIKDAT